MLRGLYTAASGMLSQQLQLDILSNNLANAHTNGYRADRVLQRAFPDFLVYRVHDQAGPTPGRPVPVGRLGTGVFVEGTALVLEAGPYQFTGNPLDVAIVGDDGFFLVQTEAGPRLTRDGAFQVDPEGWLVTRDGHPVLNPSGEPIRVFLPGQAPVSVRIDGSGGVWAGEERVDSIAVVTVEQPAALGKEGGNRFVPTETSGPWFLVANPRLEPEHREGSNVQVIGEMVRMISGFRAYEAAQKLVQAHDELLDRAVNEVGRL